jgi:hypothetical protein
MNKIPTAEEFLKEYELGNTGKIDTEDTKEAIIEFAKLHVQAQVKAILNNVSLMKQCGKKDNRNCYAIFCRNCDDMIDKDSILNAYLLENIK